MSLVYCIENLTKVYKGAKTAANDEITFSIREGEIFGLLGPNGAGKSTFINQIIGLVRPTSGSIRLFNIDVVERPQIIPEYVASQTQQMVALQDLYPGEALQYTAQLRGCRPAEARQQTASLMEELGLTALRKKRIRRFSGGQRRLMNLALTFIGERPVQIFDEPTNDLDPVVRLQVWEKLLSLQRQGKTIVVVTHNILEAERVLQRVGIINHGKLLAVGSVGELKERIDQRVKLELHLKAAYPEYLNIVAAFGDVRTVSPLHWVVLCHGAVTQQTIHSILSQIGLDQLDDFRILTPSLEDVYLQFGGTERD